MNYTKHSSYRLLAYYILISCLQGSPQAREIAQQLGEHLSFLERTQVQFSEPTLYLKNF